MIKRFLSAPMLALTLLAAGCGEQAPPAARAPVRVNYETVSLSEHIHKAALTGVIAARSASNLSFRIGGRVTERLVDVGQHVKTGDILAKIDNKTLESDVIAARANVSAAEAQLTEATATLERQKALLDKGFTTRRQYDQAEQGFSVAKSNVDATRSMLANAEQNLSFSTLRATSSGIVTAVQAEVGQVVQAAQTIVTVADDGDRDAIFNVQEAVMAEKTVSPDIQIALLSDPSISAQGHIREISPVVEQQTGSIRVKVEVKNTPAAMPLGSTVIGTVSGHAEKAVVLPWSSLTAKGDKPAVWVIDPHSKTTSLREVRISAYETDTIVVSSGLVPGDLVVTSGAQLLGNGTAVELAEEGA
jgi:RND family efflux transporter MFP subunit